MKKTIVYLTMLLLLQFSAFGQLTLKYSYDSLNRIKVVTFPDSSSIRYSYDASGNRIQKQFINPCPLIVSPTVTISGNNSICAGGSATFTTNITNGGTAPVYQWKINGNNAGINSNSFTSIALNNGDVVSCVLASNAICVNPTTVTSNAITMIVTGKVTPTINISGNNAICAGGSATFTAAITNGGSSPAYQWKVNGNNAGNNSNTFTTTLLANGDIVTCVLTSNANCVTTGTAVSNTRIMAVTANVTSTISIAGNNTICSGNPATFIAGISNGGNSPTYQWKVNGFDAGSNSNTFTSTQLTNGAVISCVLTSNASCVTSTTASSNNISMIVNSTITPTISISGNNVICAGMPATFIASGNGTGNTPVYQWKVDGLSVGANSNSFTSTNLTNGQIITCALTSSATCANPTTAVSTGDTILVSPSVTPAITINGNDSICPGVAATFTATIGNGGSSPAYQWKVDGADVGGNSNTFTSSSLINGQVITCSLTSNAFCANPVTVASNSDTMTVSPIVTPTIAINGNNVICPNSSTSFTAVISNGGNSPIYQWLVDGANTGGNSNTFTSSSLTNGQIITCSLTSNATCTNPSTVTSNQDTVIVTTSIVPSIIINGNSTFCAGTPTTFTAIANGGGGTPTYQWKINGINAGTNSNTFTSATLTNGQVVTCVLASSATCANPTTATSNSDTLTVNPTVAPTISINGNNTICPGALVTFAAAVTNEGSNPVYQWRVDGINAATNSNTFSSSVLLNGQIITCMITSNAVCANPVSVTSNADTMIVNPTLVPTISISGNNVICPGASTTFTASASNGGSTPIYQWKVDGVNSGNNSNTFTSAGLTSGLIITCDLTSNVTCANPLTVTSNSITTIVNASITPAISISGNDSICAGQFAIFNASATGAGTSPTYQWKVDGNNVGTNSSSFTSAALHTGQVVSCVLTSSASCANPVTAISNNDTMTVDPVAATTISISGNNAICPGESTTFTATIGNGGNAPVYQWKVDGINAGNNSNSFSSSTFTDGQIITCELTSNAICANPSTATSNAEIMTVSGNIMPTITISGNGTFCIGDSITFTSSVNGGGNAPTYQWQIDGVNTGTTASTFTSPVLLNRQIVTCILTSSASCANPTTVTSNSDTVIINPVLTPTISISGNNILCSATSTTFTATPANGGISPVYQWKLDGVNTGSNSNTFTSSSLTNGQIVSCVLTSNAACVNPTTVISNAVGIVVSATIVPSIAISGNNAICSGSPATFTATTYGAGSSPTYQWKVNGSNVGANSDSFTSTNLTNQQIVTCVLVGSLTCDSPVVVVSNAKTITVNPLPVTIIAPAGIAEICSGDTIELSVPIGHPYYYWNNGATTSSIQVTDSGSYWVMVTSINGCSDSSLQPAIVTINPLPAVPTISQIDDTLISTTATSYQWYLNNIPIAGATGQKQFIAENGQYMVEIIDSNGCTGKSLKTEITTVGFDELNALINFRITPNPSSGIFTISFETTLTKDIQIKVFDVIGQLVKEEPAVKVSGIYSKEINLETVAKGSYLLQLKADGKFFNRKIEIN